MDKRSKRNLLIGFTIPAFFIIASLANMKTGVKHEFLIKSDIINYIGTKVNITDIRDLFSEAKEQRDSTNYIVVHCDAVEDEVFDHVPVMEIAMYHKKKFNSHFSYHFYITKKGKVYQMHADGEKTAHARGYNDIAIAVCLQGNFDIEYLEQSQYISLIKSLVKLQAKYPRARIIGHCDISTKTCPGININVNKIREDVQGFHVLNF